MVTKWGLSERLGPLTYGEDEQEIFLGHSVTQHKNVSDETTHVIDEEVRNFIDRNYERSRRLITDNLDKLHAMAAALMKYETIDHEQIDDIMLGKPPRPPRDWIEDEGRRPRGWHPGRSGHGRQGRGAHRGPRRRALSGTAASAPEVGQARFMPHGIPRAH
jgi:cell division protease FtsH